MPEVVAFLGAGEDVEQAVGDWDADGLLDIFTCSEERNHPGTTWATASSPIPSPAPAPSDTSGKSGGIFAQTTDFIADGVRQGLFMLYGAELAPPAFLQLRGFQQLRPLPQARRPGQNRRPRGGRAGQQAGCMGDFTGVGDPSMVLVLLNGEVWFFPAQRSAPACAAAYMGVSISLSTASPNAGPVTVWASNATRSFGKRRSFAPGEPGVLYGSR